MNNDGEKAIRDAEESVETDDEGSSETLSDRPETTSEGSLDDGQIITSRLTPEMLTASAAQFSLPKSNPDQWQSLATRSTPLFSMKP